MSGLKENSKQIFEKLEFIFSPKNGYFGRVKTWGQIKNEYENIGCLIEESFLSVIENMSADKRMQLGRMITYFQIHMHPLRNMLQSKDDYYLNNLFTEMAWSHFAILIMFGIVELAVRYEEKIPTGAHLYNKGEKIKKFFIKYLSTEEQESITGAYRQDDRRLKKISINTFEEVFDDMWHKIRSEFVHEAGVEYSPLEGTILTEGGMKDGIPVILVASEVPVYKWLMYSWQISLFSLGYRGKLKIV